MLELRLRPTNAYYGGAKRYRDIKSVCFWEVFCLPWLSMDQSNRASQIVHPSHTAQQFNNQNHGNWSLKTADGFFWLSNIITLQVSTVTDLLPFADIFGRGFSSDSLVVWLIRWTFTRGYCFLSWEYVVDMFLATLISLIDFLLFCRPCNQWTKREVHCCYIPQRRLQIHSRWEHSPYTALVSQEECQIQILTS